ncbi:hypothetical protein B0T26DRAFT_797793 [Lasiosphaeria miniovina]|uniref:Uncharacterized protein n=1 Tax=Lasiosphaeria miniovina TaxID=1954250 RepID=A0AA40BGJ4_9PEZI|nr:uncharacterized protein B0T26DRAFT_797793 [Lasiosphaeria miniovina]KAK0733828.1 hypothetical protein B0T26DRAFT_797793 [Lasiosphaeria miniovina]
MVVTAVACDKWGEYGPSCARGSTTGQVGKSSAMRVKRFPLLPGMHIHRVSTCEPQSATSNASFESARRTGRQRRSLSRSRFDEIWDHLGSSFALPGPARVVSRGYADQMHGSIVLSDNIGASLLTLAHTRGKAHVWPADIDSVSPVTSAKEISFVKACRQAQEAFSGLVSGHCIRKVNDPSQKVCDPPFDSLWTEGGDATEQKRELKLRFGAH